MYLFFDTETTGLPKNWKAPMQQVDNWPRVIQLAWQVADEAGRVLQTRSFLVKPDGWEVPSVDMFMKQGMSEQVAIEKARFWIHHGYTTQQNQLEGEDMDMLLDQFLTDYEQCSWMVAHNVSYDHPVLGAEMLRYGKKASKRIDKFCTMLATVDFCKIPGQYGYKWPKLEELYRKTFGRDFDGAHDAGADVGACRECFFELKERGVIVLP